ncbi:MAG: glycosyl hydrolase [Candidatus Saccharicenans sp.]|nr:glycosyl hydrolase [Candidatus Saccharicenans sp.]
MKIREAFNNRIIFKIAAWFACFLLAAGCQWAKKGSLEEGFRKPADEYRPGAYWYFMDGNLSREAMTADLEAMKKAGLSWALFLEVNVGVPRGRVDFLSNEWQDLFTHAVREAERLGIRLIVGSGPGWAGSGGPWVTPEQSMQHLVASETRIKGPGRVKLKLPVPEPKKPFFGEESLTPELKKIRDAWFQDVAVLAFPMPEEESKISLIDEKALYYRAPFTSQPGLWPYLPPPAEDEGDKGSESRKNTRAKEAISPGQIINLTDYLQPDGMLDWEAPSGNWTVMRFVARNNGAVTRPAPVPGLGFECDKFSREAFEAHFEAYAGKLIHCARPRQSPTGGGWKMIHIDSWEMGAQNWTQNFRREFKRRRGYDPLPYFPVYAGLIVGSREESERFLWDLRRTSSELIVENHAEKFKELGRRYGFTLSIEPYDMNPAADFDLGAVAEVPMGEFWSDGYGFNSAFSVIEATSIGHVMGRPIIAAESFTAMPQEAWKKYPRNMKDQTDWAFCQGLNRLIFHTFVHNPLDERLKPGMTMGPYGVHWDRNQTWWSMVRPYHDYIAKCQFVLSQGKPVADILYLTPEGAPQVFRPAPGATEGTDFLPDKRGYSFDGCSPAALMKLAKVEGGKIVFSGGASYRLMILPALETMTPELLTKVEELVREGAVVIGRPPRRSPSLENYPECDRLVQQMAEKVWGNLDCPKDFAVRHYGKGKIFWGGKLTPESVRSNSNPLEARLYPDYEDTAAVLKEMGVEPGFICSSGKIRYTHRSLPEDGREIYFISNRTGEHVEDVCRFRDGSVRAELWDPVTGEIREPNGIREASGGVELGIRLEPHQSIFIVFKRNFEKGDRRRRPQNESKFEDEMRLSYQTKQGNEGELSEVKELKNNEFESERMVQEKAVNKAQKEKLKASNLVFMNENESKKKAERLEKSREGKEREEIENSGRKDKINKKSWPDEENYDQGWQAKRNNSRSWPDKENNSRNWLEQVTSSISRNFPEPQNLMEIAGPWKVSFDPNWGGPGEVVFERLLDWTKHPAEGIRYYSGTAVYSVNFDLPAGLKISRADRIYLDLGEVHCLARVRLNGKELGVVWTAPNRVSLKGVLRKKGNHLEIEVANLWVNRLIGDENEPWDGVAGGKWPDWLLKGQPRPTKRYTFTTHRFYQQGDPLLPSGLLGPVLIQKIGTT